jgi:pyruvate kinase
MRRAKIICTIGPAVHSPQAIEQLVVNGMDAARLNFSHGTHEDHTQTITWLRETSQRLRKPLAIIADLQGPKIRTGETLDGKPVELHPGQRLILTTESVPGSAERMSVTYPHLPEDVVVGDRILLDDGLLELQVRETDKVRQVITEVIVGGLLGEHKGINLPGVALQAEALTPKDRTDLGFALAHGVDYVALSFVRRPEDLSLARQVMQRAGRVVPLIIDALVMMDRIMRVAEAQKAKERSAVPTEQQTLPADTTEVTCRIACRAAQEAGAAVIAAFTLSGMTARLLSRFRPGVPIVAFSPAEDVQRRLSLFWGVIPRIIEPMTQADILVRRGEEELVAGGFARHGDRIVLVFGAPISLVAGRTNSIRLHKIEQGDDNVSGAD